MIFNSYVKLPEGITISKAPNLDFLLNHNFGIPTPLKNMISSVGMMTFPIYGKTKFMFQNTNQTNITSKPPTGEISYDSISLVNPTVWICWPDAESFQVRSFCESWVFNKHSICWTTCSNLVPRFLSISLLYLKFAPELIMPCGGQAESGPTSRSRKQFSHSPDQMEELWPFGGSSHDGWSVQNHGCLTCFLLVGGLNPCEKYWSNGIIVPNRWKKTCSKPPTSYSLGFSPCFFPGKA